MNNKIDEILKSERINSTIDFNEIDTLSDLKDVKIDETHFFHIVDTKMIIEQDSDKVKVGSVAHCFVREFSQVSEKKILCNNHYGTIIEYEYLPTDAPISELFNLLVTCRARVRKRIDEVIANNGAEFY